MMIQVVSFYPKNFGAVFQTILIQNCPFTPKIKLNHAPEVVTHKVNVHWVVSIAILNAL